jgi:uncharacterized protein (TIGR03435 family)
MNRVIAVAGLIGAITSGFAWSQSAPALFAEATVRRLSVPSHPPGIDILDGSVTLTGFGFRALVAKAYGVKEYQVAGGPAKQEDIYQIDAIAKSTPTEDQVRAMAQALLADQFRLKVHREMQDLAAYNLAVAKGGPKMKENEPGVFGMTTAGVSHIDFATASMGALAKELYVITGRPVFDQTGLTGNYDFRLDWIMDETKSHVFIPMVERLGLKLEPITVLTEMVVIDHVEVPSKD